jgi:hypothetical protein
MIGDDRRQFFFEAYDEPEAQDLIEKEWKIISGNPPRLRRLIRKLLAARKLRSMFRGQSMRVSRLSGNLNGNHRRFAFYLKTLVPFFDVVPAGL